MYRSKTAKPGASFKGGEGSTDPQGFMILVFSLQIVPLIKRETAKMSTRSVYSTHFQAEHVVDHCHEISTFQHNPQCIMPRFSRIVNCRPC